MFGHPSLLWNAPPTTGLAGTRRSSNKLQWFVLKVVHQPSSTSNVYQAACPIQKLTPKMMHLVSSNTVIWELGRGYWVPDENDANQRRQSLPTIYRISLLQIPHAKSMHNIWALLTFNFTGTRPIERKQSIVRFEFQFDTWQRLEV